MADAIAMEVRAAAASERLLLRVPLEVYFRHHPALRGQTSVILARSQGEGPVSVALETYDGSKFCIDRIACSPESAIRAETATGEPASRQTVLLRLKPSASTAVSQASVDVFTKEHPGKPYRLTALLVD